MCPARRPELACNLRVLYLCSRSRHWTRTPSAIRSTPARNLARGVPLSADKRSRYHRLFVQGPRCRTRRWLSRLHSLGTPDEVEYVLLYQSVVADDFGRQRVDLHQFVARERFVVHDMLPSL